MLKRFLRLSPDDAPSTDAPAPAPQGEPPPAATLVEKSGVKEGDAGELLRLKRENEALSRKVKLRETEVSEKEDALRRLTSPPETPATPAAPERDEETPWTFFG